MSSFCWLGGMPLDLDAVNVEIDLVTLSSDPLTLPMGTSAARGAEPWTQSREVVPGWPRPLRARPAAATRWRRAALALPPALVVALLLTQAVANRVLAATFVLGGVPVQLVVPAAEATGLEVEAAVIRGDFVFERIVIGRDGAALTEGGVLGPEGASAIQAAGITANGLETEVLSVSATTYRMTGLHAEVVARGEGC